MSRDISRSAMVLATLRILEYARADNPSLPISTSITFRHSSSSGQCFSRRRLLISAFVNIPSSANRCFCRVLALRTRPATTSLDSPFFRPTSFTVSTGWSQSWMSIHTKYFWGQYFFYYICIKNPHLYACKRVFLESIDCGAAT